MTTTSEEQRRQLIADAHEKLRAAVTAARLLMTHDRLHGSHAPGPGPGSATWADDLGPFEYLLHQAGAQRRLGH